MLEQFSALHSNHEHKRLIILGLILLGPTLLLAVALNYTPFSDTIEIDAMFSVGTDHSRPALSQNSPSQPPGASNDFDWPLIQVAASVGILLLVMIGFPLGYRLTNSRRHLK